MPTMDSLPLLSPLSTNLQKADTYYTQEYPFILEGTINTRSSFHHSLYIIAIVVMA